MNGRTITASLAGGLAALGLGAALSLAHGPAAHAQGGRMTVQTVIDRARIEDLLEHYYWNFGSSSDSFASFYTKDAELVLGPKSYKGLEGIKGAYAGVPKDAPQRKSYSFNVLMSNPLVVVDGDRATAQLVFTEVVVDKQGEPPRILTQGREFDHLVKQNGQWLISRRQIMDAAGKPADWPK